MPKSNLAEIEEKIAAQHEGDEKQLEVIFSGSPRLIVEAPAGYGKTTTMISRIAYLYSTGKIPNPKRILGLTFSVNAALKVKRDVAEKLPSLLGSHNSPIALGDKVTITNYHGFCKSILRKYGHLVADALRKDINLFRAIGGLKNSDGKITVEWKNIADSLTATEQDVIVETDNFIMCGTLPNPANITTYTNLISKKLLPLGYITHNAVILFTLRIFSGFPEVKKFYQSYYPLIVVDEFQDTNCIAWALAEAIISDQTQLVFLGDPLQRIYGFIGALPNIMATATEKYQMSHVALSKNYRFRNNPEMLKLDKNIRANAASCFMPNVQGNDVANLPAFWGNTQKVEAECIATKIEEILSSGTDKISILFRARSKNAEIVESELSERNIEYFYGMFMEEQPEYTEFHNKCQELFIKRFGNSKTINKKALAAFTESVKSLYSSSTDKTTDSLLHLLDALVKKVSIDYAELAAEDKYSVLLDIFENRQLKQAMEYVDSRVILSTVHGAKGLEWDYVFLADVERWVFPGYFTCKDCPNKFASAEKSRCSLPKTLSSDFKETALDELSVFYVAVTRAKKQVFVSASASRLDFSGNDKDSIFSCMTSINGIKLINAVST